MDVIFVAACVIFAIGYGVAQLVFKTQASKVWGGILFGVGAIVLVVAVLFVGCLLNPPRF